ncbi:hypothetical protein CGMCC3_g10041 [Colletotrichum fructicola]|nr:uncharacterized protein CGMCC3_g10041 [Colletotrichum fructicola]KAE9573755.1 hypothetical protein CGMCC3_g10041 [Colletotrichum fructicola]
MPPPTSTHQYVPVIFPQTNSLPSPYSDFALGRCQGALASHPETGSTWHNGQPKGTYTYVGSVTRAGPGRVNLISDQDFLPSDRTNRRIPVSPSAQYLEH